MDPATARPFDPSPHSWCRGVATSAADGACPPPLPLLIGVAAALASTRIVSSLLFVTTPRDLAAFGTAAALTLLAALIATLLPARRAAQVDPMVALRHE